jgi:hypothetical protein
MSSFVSFEDRSFLSLVVPSTSEVLFFEVDPWVVPWLERIGNFHVVYSRHPRNAPPVVRRRGPMGHGVELSILKIVAALKAATSDEVRSSLVSDYGLLIDACKQIRMSRYPQDGNKLNCKLDNWNRPANTIIPESLSLDSIDEHWVPPIPEDFVSPSAEGVPNPRSNQTSDGIPIIPSEVGATRDKVNAKVSVDDILSLARGGRPEGDWEQGWKEFCEKQEKWKGYDLVNSDHLHRQHHA